MLAPLLALALLAPNEQQICDAINQRRAENGRQPLVVETGLYSAAKQHSDDMALNCGSLQHSSCNGEVWTKRVQRFYPGWVALGETVSLGFGADDTVNGWMNSPDHRAILLNSAFTEFGCAITFGDTPFGSFGYATVDFGSRGMLPVQTPRPTVTPSPTVAPPASVTNWSLRHTSRSTTLLATVALPAGARVDAPVSLELDDRLVVAISEECVMPRSRGAYSNCGVKLTIAPAGLPYYRLRLQFDGAYAADSVRLAAAGQTWVLQ